MPAQELDEILFRYDEALARLRNPLADEFDALFDDKELAEILNGITDTPAPPEPQTLEVPSQPPYEYYIPLTLEEITQPALMSRDTLKQEPPAPAIPGNPAAYEPPPDIREKYRIFPDKPESEKKQQEPIITDKQLRALNKKHLLMMIRDLEKELAREKEEKQNLLLAIAKSDCQERLSRAIVKSD